MNEILVEVMQISRQNPDGFTLDLRTMQYVPDGYAVAYEETQDSFGLEGLEKVIKHAQSHDNYVGGWRADNGYYFDSIMIVDDLEEAMRLGRENHQIAICKLKGGIVIKVD